MSVSSEAPNLGNGATMREYSLAKSFGTRTADLLTWFTRPANALNDIP
jgi:hypothetical protein